MYSIAISMGLGFWDLIKSTILFLNALAILNDRFLRKVGWEKPGPDAPSTIKNRILNMIHTDARAFLRSLLIVVNICWIMMEILMG